MAEVTNNSNGVLYIVGTPIGNLKDITFRAVEILQEVDLILAEDTRRTRNLLQHFDIKKPMESFNEHNSYMKIDKVILLLKSGKRIAQVSDAGMPVISDPGFNLVKRCHEEGIPVKVIPGPSALTSALALSGFPGTHFYFAGFMPKDKNRRRLLRKLNDIKEIGLINTLVFFESPERLNKTLLDILNILGNCDIFIARELTKVYEESFFGKVKDAIEKFDQVKGELTVVVKIKSDDIEDESESDES